MGLQNGQPLGRDAKKDCIFLRARGRLGHLRRLAETVQRATEDLPAGPRPPTHCHLHFSLPQFHAGRRGRHFLAGRERLERRVNPSGGWRGRRSREEEELRRRGEWITAFYRDVSWRDMLASTIHHR